MRMTRLIAPVLLLGTSSFALSQATEQSEPNGPNEVPLMMEAYPEWIHFRIYGAGEANGSHQIVEPRKLWGAGRTLRVCFFAGNPAIHHVVAEVAQEWTGPNGANLRLDFGTPGNYRSCLDPSAVSDIRISFTAPGYWSMVGRESIENFEPLEPSMNFQNFHRRYRAYTPATVMQALSPEDRGVILHEFGHALGFQHEQQDPRLHCWDEIKWSGPGNVYDVMWELYSWEPSLVDQNIRPIINRVVSPVLPPNPESIMMYSFDPRILNSGANSRCYVTARVELHASDLAAAARIYPQGPAAITFSETSLPDVPVRAIPAAAAPAAHRLFREQVVNDLQNSDARVRRDARSRLATYLQNASTQDVQQILASVPAGNYRHQLGVAVALDASDADLSAEQTSLLTRLRSRTAEPTLRNALQRVLSNDR